MAGMGARLPIYAFVSRATADRVSESRTALASPQRSNRLNATCVSNTSCDIGCSDSSFTVCDSNSSTPACPRSEAGCKKVTAGRITPNSPNAAESEHAIIAGVEGEANRCFSPAPSLRGAASIGSRCGIQSRAPGVDASPPLKSITVAPARLAMGACWRAKAAEPVKNTKRTRSKLDASTFCTTVGSPPTSVRVPASGSSSTRRISPAGNPPSSIQLFKSLPGNEVAPAIAIRSDSLPRGMVLGGARSGSVMRGTNDVQGKTRDHVSGRDQHQYHLRIDDDRPDQQRANDDGQRMLPTP